MGDVYWGVHLPLAAGAARLGLRTCVETGTYFGSGAVHLSALFDRVITIDASPSSVAFCRETFGSVLSNVTFLEGNSGVVIREVLAVEVSPVFVFLDAHWFPGADPSLEGGSQCPLSEELAAIEDRPDLISAGSVVLIDDADMLLRSLPSSFHDEEFPEIAAVVGRLGKMGFQHVSVCDDVIVAGPAAMAEVEGDYLRLRREVGKPGAKRIG